ncbi:hypothetical protein L3Q82_003767 [Xyrichtys novacula]|uniref:G-protein coupled receptors family 1 profile domain-containing protein n=1 Tax=Xyrichtys novacula TaxID=13765 RepID=A0AAV1EHQ7_XYRNO|nr:hypothetical protein L3Q82_003767 [Xyrichtys novacula]
MSINSSSNSDCASIIPPTCMHRVTKGYVFISLSLATIALILPLSITVLHLGFQQWRRSVSSPSSVSFSDFFTYNLAVMELIGVFGFVVRIAASFSRLQVLSSVGLFTTVFPWNGQMFFPILSSVDRYLAVVHPIIYLRLKQRRGVCIRNLCTTAV